MQETSFCWSFNFGLAFTSDKLNMSLEPGRTKISDTGMFTAPFLSFKIGYIHLRHPAQLKRKFSTFK